MSELTNLQQLFDAATSAIEARYQELSAPAEDVSPLQLLHALRQLLQLFENIDREYGANDALVGEDPSNFGEHGLRIAADLADWADRLRLPQARSALEKIAVGIALWVTRHSGEIRVLETVVNGFANSANVTMSQQELSTLFRETQAVLEHVAPSIKADTDQSNPGRPWRVLNFNSAIIATRTQDEQLMHQAFDTLGRNLPQDAASFFEEGLKQAEKPVYGSMVKSVMQEYFSRWAVKH